MFDVPGRNPSSWSKRKQSRGRVAAQRSVEDLVVPARTVSRDIVYVPHHGQHPRIQRSRSNIEVNPQIAKQRSYSASPKSRGTRRVHAGFTGSSSVVHKPKRTPSLPYVPAVITTNDRTTHSQLTVDEFWDKKKAFSHKAALLQTKISTEADRNRDRLASIRARRKESESAGSAAVPNCIFDEARKESSNSEPCSRCFDEHQMVRKLSAENAALRRYLQDVLECHPERASLLPRGISACENESRCRASTPRCSKLAKLNLLSPTNKSPETQEKIEKFLSEKGSTQTASTRSDSCSSCYQHSACSRTKLESVQRTHSCATPTKPREITTTTGHRIQRERSWIPYQYSYEAQVDPLITADL